MADKDSSRDKGSEGSPKKKRRRIPSSDSDTSEGGVKSDAPDSDSSQENRTFGSPKTRRFEKDDPESSADSPHAHSSSSSATYIPSYRGYGADPSGYGGGPSGYGGGPSGAKDSSRDKDSKDSDKKKGVKRRFQSDSDSDSYYGREKYGRKPDERGYGRPDSGSRRGGARDTSPSANRGSSPPYGGGPSGLGGGPSGSGGGATTSSGLPGSSTGAVYRAALKKTEIMATESKEVFRLNCLRERESKNNWVACVRIPVNAEQMEVLVVPNDYSRFYYSQNRNRIAETGIQFQYRVRVPATMLFDVRPHSSGAALTSNQYVKQLRSHFLEEYRRQSGYHLFVDCRNRKLSWLNSYWWTSIEGNRRKYHLENVPTRVNAIFPHLMLSHSQGNIQVVMGLVFSNPTHFPYTRTQGRVATIQDQTLISRDMRESYLDQSESLNCRTSKAMVAFAFYVCRGARLMVTDEVFSPADQVKPAKPKQHHCRSLFQQGSLVVVYDTVRPDHCIKTKGVNSSYFWQTFYKEYLIPRYDTDVFSADEKQLDGREYRAGRNLANCNRRVYFLGAVESEHNSVCWNLGIVRSRTPGRTHMSHLRFPEGGYIEDITTWNVGWQLALARHRYERLFESVLEVPALPAVPAIPFAVPQDRDVLRRILGIRGARKAVLNIDYNAENMPRDYEDSGHRRDRDIRRYLNLKGLTKAKVYREVESVWFHNEEMLRRPGWKQFLPTPPLYPPIIVKFEQDDGTIKYRDRILSPYDKIVRSSPHSGPHLHPTHIEEMGFRVKDKTGQYISSEYELAMVRTYGQLWKTIGYDYTESERIGRDYLGQSQVASTEDQEPEMEALVLIRKGTANTGWPWEGTIGK